MKKLTTHTHGFKVHAPNLLNELCHNNGMGALKIPLNVFQQYLKSVTERASQLNDPILNNLMCEMALYEIADPESKDYNPELVDKVREMAKAQKKEAAKKK